MSEEQHDTPSPSGSHLGADDANSVGQLSPHNENGDSEHDEHSGPLSDGGRRDAGEEDEYQSGDEYQEDEPAAIPAAGSGGGVDMSDALAKARAIAAKLGSMQRLPPPAAQSLDDTTDSVAYVDVPAAASGDHADMRDRRGRRRSASPDDRGRGYSKRGRGDSRERPREQRRYDEAGGGSSGAGGMIEFMVPAALVGLIIGRSGSNLRGIEQQHGVRIQLDPNFDKRDQERRMTIEGAPHPSEAARREIFDFIERHQQQQQQPFAPPPGAAAAPPSAYGEQHGSAGMTTIMVPSSKVGLIIGRGGESIRDIQFASGARVQVQPDNGRGAPERPIQLIGAPEQIEVARARIMEIVASERGSGGGVGGGVGGRDGGHMAGGDSYQRHEYSGGMPPGGARGSYGGGGARGGPPPSDRGGGSMHHVEEMQIPSEAVGIVIGRGGETIKHLQQASGARIQVIQGPDRSGPSRPVTISGEHGACMRARRMIEEKVEGAQERQGGGHGSAGGGYGGGRSGQYAASAASSMGYDQQSYQQPQRGGYNGGYGDSAVEQKSWGQQQPSYYGGGQQQAATQYGAQAGYQQQQDYQAQGASSSAGATQWTNQMAADHYTQYIATNPEYAQYAEYYRKLAEKDPNGIVPSGN
ncbi:hypothetical protein H4R26_000705 [Coemansia thaxteri]|uniref:K Homology domain-containing protein n=1 Tax=Coemansia thaxteri TaxID=2663907 RepID=A0A9W8BHV0_9FUNG|nr:hypothetical protein H4R26_000705 [Coemansia thaxteri]KAJ2487792.1 hypothetical protein EV174_000325 [Coemansia sp. RSA 2320]